MTIEYDNDFLEFLNLKNKKINEIGIRNKVFSLLYPKKSYLHKYFLKKLEILVKKRKNYYEKLGFDLNQIYNYNLQNLDDNERISENFLKNNNEIIGFNLIPKIEKLIKLFQKTSLDNKFNDKGNHINKLTL